MTVVSSMSKTKVQLNAMQEGVRERCKGSAGVRERQQVATRGLSQLMLLASLIQNAILPF